MTGSAALLRSLFEKGKYTILMALTEKGVFFILFAFLARTTDTAGYGTIVAAFAFANILNSFFELGLGSYLQREFSFGTSRLRERLSTIVTVKLFLFIVFASVTIAYNLQFSLPITVETLTITALIYSSGFAALFGKVLYGLDRFRDSFTALMKSRLVIPLGLTVILLLKLPASVLLTFLFAAIILQSYLLFRRIRECGIDIGISFDRRILTEILHSSLPMGIGVAFVWIYDKLDVLLIRHIISLDSVAVYAAAYSVYKFPQMFSGMLLTPLYSDLSARFSREGKLYVSDVALTGMFLSGTAVCAVAVMHWIPGLIITAIYGNQYVRSGEILAMLSFALPALFLNNFTGVMLNSIRKERNAMTSALIALCVNVAGNLILLPMMGIYGAVISTLCAEYCILAVQLLMLRSSHSIRWNRTV